MKPDWDSIVVIVLGMVVPLVLMAFAGASFVGAGGRWCPVNC